MPMWLQRNTHASLPTQAAATTAVVGMSLVEVLFALAIAALAFSGLFLATQGVLRGVRLTMERSIESAFLQTALAEINPYADTIETAYDMTTRTSRSLPNGRTFHVTRLVGSSATAADTKTVSVFLYHNATDANPYRRLQKEISPVRLNYNLGSNSWWKDNSGQVWIPWSSPMATVSLTEGSRRNGVVTANTSNTSYTLANAGPNMLPFTTGHTATTPLQYTFMARQNTPYKLQLGFVSPNTGSQNVTVTINGQARETFNLVAAAGGTAFSPHVRTYTVTPTSQSGVSVIRVQVSWDGTTTHQLSTLSLERLAN